MNGARLADATGAGLLVLVGVAVLVSARANPGSDPLPLLTTLAAGAIAYVAGRLLAQVIGAVAVLVVGALGVRLVLGPTSIAGLSLAAPLGYANANAALYVQIAALAGLAAITATDGRSRTLATVVAAGFVVFVAATGSAAGFLTALAVLAAVVVALTGSRPRRQAWAAGCVTVVLTAHLAVLALGATYEPGRAAQSPAHTVAASWLTERRLALWHDAVAIANDHPATGVGPGGFPTTSPTALRDPDTREGHSATLQMAAETGWLGGLALLGLLVWAAIRPLLSGGRGAAAGGALVAALSASALAVHASVDYVLAYSVVVAAAGLVLGIGSAEHVPATPTDPRAVRDRADRPGTRRRWLWSGRRR